MQPKQGTCRDTVREISFDATYPWREGETPHTQAALIAWMHAATGLTISDLFETVFLTRAFEAATQMPDNLKIEIFDRFAPNVSAYVSVHHEMASRKDRMAADCLIAGMLVDCVITHDCSKNTAIKDTQRKLSELKHWAGKNKIPNRHLVNRSRKTEIEAVWKKYEKVLHYAPVAAFAQFGEPLVSPVDAEAFPPLALETLRQKNLAREALIMKVI